MMTKHNLLPYDLRPTTLTYNPSLAKVKVDPHAKNQVQWSNGSKVRVSADRQTDGQTDRRTKCIISPASQLIIIILSRVGQPHQIIIMMLYVNCIHN